MTQPQDERAAHIGAAYAGIAVGALAVLGATAVALRWIGRPRVRKLDVGRGGLRYRGAAPRAGAARGRLTDGARRA